jgi:hypothetical protein
MLTHAAITAGAANAGAYRLSASSAVATVRIPGHRSNAAVTSITAVAPVTVLKGVAANAARTTIGCRKRYEAAIATFGSVPTISAVSEVARASACAASCTGKPRVTAITTVCARGCSKNDVVLLSDGWTPVPAVAAITCVAPTTVSPAVAGLTTPPSGTS